MTSRYITVHVGLFGIFVTVLTALLYVACFYEQEWAFDSIHPNTQHAPTSCDIVKVGPETGRGGGGGGGGGGVIR